MDSNAVTNPLGVRRIALMPDVVTSAQATAAMVSTCAPDGPATTLPGTLLRAGALMRQHAAVAATTLLSRRAMARYARQHASQHTSPKFVTKSRIAATGGAATGPHPAWDPV